MAKYEALGEFLRRQQGERVPMTFAEIERVIGARLPPSARKHRPWWSNSPTNSVMTQVWLDAGFESEQVDMAGRRLVFRRVRGAAGQGLAEPASAYHAAAGRADALVTATTLTGRQFEQDIGGARKAAQQGPVFITDHGRPEHVLLTIDHYRRLATAHVSLGDVLAQDGADFDFDPPRMGSSIFKPADLG
jgi:hypothetical protein